MTHRAQQDYRGQFIHPQQKRTATAVLSVRSSIPTASGVLAGDALLGDVALQFAGVEHLADDVAAAGERDPGRTFTFARAMLDRSCREWVETGEKR